MEGASGRRSQSSRGNNTTERNDTGNNASRKIAVEEKCRSKRLFGNLMTSLGRIQKDSLSNSFRSQEKRRREIEQKIRDKLQNDVTEGDNNQAMEENLGNEKIIGSRSIVEPKSPITDTTEVGNELNVEVLEKRSRIEETKRNKRLLYESSFLKTQTSPPILFLPKVLTVEQEDTLDAQRAECKLLQESIMIENPMMES
ncbi:hypothetical protein NADFUDRAFT_80416 [Nadsonia fulvescens var. elongata DSM 6958]|uniref:Pinin/SDK/MemA protein domain-containing protein n=1 Tax=Nadsonia fulvescens var. elongata DSM 6958 TaxID=857566 RepID=A0A1E3PE02_9ASCO|nr:hypothetical protein NADFUDRAFT_80416 [Nadsonia fulvescens var. elongata DSM 6958]